MAKAREALAMDGGDFQGPRHLGFFFVFFGLGVWMFRGVSGFRGLGFRV